MCINCDLNFGSAVIEVAIDSDCLPIQLNKGETYKLKFSPQDSFSEKQIFTISKEYNGLNSGQKKAVLNALVEWANAEFMRLREGQE